MGEKLTRVHKKLKIIIYYKLLFRGFLALLWVPKRSLTEGGFKPLKVYRLGIFNIMFSCFWCFCPICNNVARKKPRFGFNLHVFPVFLFP